MKHLAFFFKDPMGVKEHDLIGQWKRLEHHVNHEPEAPKAAG